MYQSTYIKKRTTYNIECTTYNEKCTAYNKDCTTYNEKYTTYNRKSTRSTTGYNIKRTVYNVKCTLYINKCTSYIGKPHQKTAMAFHKKVFSATIFLHMALCRQSWVSYDAALLCLQFRVPISGYAFSFSFFSIIFLQVILFSLVAIEIFYTLYYEITFFFNVRL